MQSQPRSGDPQRTLRLVDDYDNHNSNGFYEEHTTLFPKLKPPAIFGEISSLFGSIKTQIFGMSGGKYFIKELKQKYPENDFSEINFE